MKLLLFGGGGQIGGSVVHLAGDHGIAMAAPPRSLVDLREPGAVREAVEDSRASCVINAAAYTAVDEAEEEPEEAFRVNRDGARHVAEACASGRIPLVHLSTDYVFDGQRRSPYPEDAATAPLSVYGRSKLAGEQAVRQALQQHVVIRTSWVFSARPGSFPRTMLSLAREREVIQVVDDQIGGPSAASDVAGALIQIARALERGSADWGVYHYQGRPATTWLELARRTLEASACRDGPYARLEPTSTEDLGAPAPRPLYSVLDCSAALQAFGIEQPDWRPRVVEVVEEALQGRR